MAERTKFERMKLKKRSWPWASAFALGVCLAVMPESFAEDGDGQPPEPASQSEAVAVVDVGIASGVTVFRRENDNENENETASAVVPSDSSGVDSPQGSRRFGPGVTAVRGGESMSSLGMPVWRIFLSMMVLIGLIVGTLFLLKKLGRRFGALPDDSKMRVVSRMALDQKNSLVMVRVYEQEVLLGIGANGISLLGKYHALTEEDTEEDAGAFHDVPVNVTVGKRDGIGPDLHTVESLREMK